MKFRYICKWIHLHVVNVMIIVGVIMTRKLDQLDQPGHPVFPVSKVLEALRVTMDLSVQMVNQELLDQLEHAGVLENKVRVAALVQQVIEAIKGIQDPVDVLVILEQLVWWDQRVLWEDQPVLRVHKVFKEYKDLLVGMVREARKALKVMQVHKDNKDFKE